MNYRGMAFLFVLVAITSTSIGAQERLPAGVVNISIADISLGSALYGIAIRADDPSFDSVSHIQRVIGITDARQAQALATYWQAMRLAVLGSSRQRTLEFCSLEDHTTAEFIEAVNKYESDIERLMVAPRAFLDEESYEKYVRYGEDRRANMISVAFHPGELLSQHPSIDIEAEIARRCN